MGFFKKWLPRRIAHIAFVWSLWACVWFVGTYPLGRPVSEGYRFMFTVSFFARCGFSAAWMFITNFTHSHPWNKFLANDQSAPGLCCTTRWLSSSEGNTAGT